MEKIKIVLHCIPKEFNKSIYLIYYYIIFFNTIKDMM